jgi:hypothetical protein
MTQAIEVNVDLKGISTQCLVRKLHRNVPFLHNGSVYIVPVDCTTDYVCYAAFAYTPVIKIHKTGKHTLLIWQSEDTVNPIYLNATFNFEQHSDF